MIGESVQHEQRLGSGIPSRETLTKIFYRRSLEDQFVNLLRHREDIVRIEVSTLMYYGELQ